MSTLTLSIDRLNGMKPTEIVKDEAVKERFVIIAQNIWTNGDENAAIAAYEHESLAFNRALTDKPELQRCTKFSIFSTFIDMAVSGLSLQAGTCPQVYLLNRNYLAGKDQNGQNVYENRMVLTVSGYGELVMRKRAGQILHADNPVVVYANDEFAFSDKGGKKTVDYTCHLPHQGQPIVACFMKIIRNDGSVDYGVMFPEDWNRLAAYSAKQNSRWDAQARRRVLGNPNELYSSDNGQIDKGFLIAKCIKHSFKTYPKVKTGNATIFEADIDNNPEEDYYKVEQPANPQPAPEQQPFGAPVNNVAQGVVVNPATQPAEQDDGAF